MGGHSGSEETVRDIRLRSLRNFPRALDQLGRTIDVFDIFDNSAHGTGPQLIAAFLGRQITHLDPQLPAWLTEALQGTPYSTPNLQALFQEKQPLPARGGADIPTPESRKHAASPTD